MRFSKSDTTYGIVFFRCSTIFIIKTDAYQDAWNILKTLSLVVTFANPLALLRNYVNDKSQMQDLNMESDTESQEPDRFLNTLTGKVENLHSM